jgi:molecular chaperone DnaK (HSP70)
MSSSNSNPNQIPKEVPDVIGIKFGSRNTVLGIVKNHAVDTLTLSNREIASMVSFTKNNRTFEDSAQISFLKNISSTYINLNRLIGLKYESNEFLEHEKKFMFFDYEYNNDIKEYLYECQYKQKLPIENIIASFFTHLNKAIINRDNKKQINGMVVSIPDYFNLYQRKIMLNILNISGIKCYSLLNESSAVCLSYFIHHYKSLEANKEKIICFIDLGQSKLSLHLCSFTNKEIKILYSKSNKFIGCRDFDMKILSYLEKIYPEQLANIKKNKKYLIKLLQTIEKNRKMITVNKESTLNFELGEDNINFNLTREKFNEIINEDLDLFKNFISEFFSEAKVDIKKVESFEMVGDMIRNPIFQEIITEFAKKNINKTMVADECIAQGCAFYAALLDGHFSPICDFNLIQYMTYDIYFTITGKELKIEQNLIQKGDNYPIRKAFKFKNEFINKEDILNICFNLNKENNNDEYICKYEIQIEKMMKFEKNKDLIIEILIDSNCIPSFDKCYFFDKDGYLSEMVNINIVNEYPVSNFKNDELLKNEIDLQFRDFDTMNKNNKKNEIEGIIYKLRDGNVLDNKNKIDEKLEQIINLDDIEKLDEEYNVLINKYNLHDKLEEDHEKIKIIYRNINELQKKDKDKTIDINKFNEKGIKICKVIDKFKDIKLNNINDLI